MKVHTITAKMDLLTLTEYCNDLIHPIEGACPFLVRNKFAGHDIFSCERFKTLLHITTTKGKLRIKRCDKCLSYGDILEIQAVWQKPEKPEEISEDDGRVSLRRMILQLEQLAAVLEKRFGKDDGAVQKLEKMLYELDRCAEAVGFFASSVGKYGDFDLHEEARNVLEARNPTKFERMRGPARLDYADALLKILIK